MHSREPHPARRTGEKNYAGPGRDWGKNCHVLPGRREGEKNYQTRRKQMSHGLILPSFDEGLAAGPRDDASAEVQGAAPSSMNESIAATFDVMKSLSELIRVLEGIRSVSNENDTCSADERLLDKHMKRSSLGDDDGLSRPWVLAVVDQLAVLSAAERIPSLNHSAKARGYGDRILAANDVVSKVSH
jgi:hypothetical protein